MKKKKFRFVFKQWLKHYEEAWKRIRQLETEKVLLEYKIEKLKEENKCM